MKTICILLLALISFKNTNTTQDLKTAKAIFDGYEDGTYYFTDSEDDEKYYSFEKIDESILKTYDLTSKKYDGKVFNITYKIESEKDEFDEYYDVWVIVKVALL
ncbi:hypothetical protein FUA26_12525 [Seonamhaeicola algicola]|uniref:DUF4377 domain-containing protein n=2 Tax=Seonamhaeicola TaxID=1649495 RepID=A0A5C7AHW2_9FLAO|nr:MULTISPECIES: hypothetical protein [Seonamhaeicola]TXE07043.1 hypothetical protein FUA26_12525 [Seonamhaeicola algicola]TYA68374.1 hypothetical protein FUA24_23470 [Seonamhaeicola marinus]